MFKRKTIYSAVAASALLAVTAVSTAAETATGTATVTVQNAFDFDQVTAINFGTLRATQQLDAAGGAGTIAYSEVAKYTIVTDGGSNTQVPYSGSDADVRSAITEIVAGTPAEFAITNAAPFTTLTVTTGDPTTALDSDLNGDVSIVDTFTLTTPSSATSIMHAYIDNTDVRISGGSNDGDTLDLSQPQTDATGAVNLIVGANLYIKRGAAAVVDGAYTGSYTIEVSY